MRAICELEQRRPRRKRVKRKLTRNIIKKKIKITYQEMIIRRKVKKF